MDCIPCTRPAVGVFPNIEMHLIPDFGSLVAAGKIPAMKKYALPLVAEKPESSFRGPFFDSSGKGFTHRRRGREFFAPKASALLLFLVVVV